MPLKIFHRVVPGCGWGYGPPDDGPFPAILLLHGSEGKWSGWIYRTAVILAAHGFLAIPFGYSNGGNGWNAGDIIDVPLDRTAEALAALRTRIVGRQNRTLRSFARCRTCAVVGVADGQRRRGRTARCHRRAYAPGRDLRS